MRFFSIIILPLLVIGGLLEGYQLLTDSTAVTSSVANMVFENNLHEVVPGKLYRSAEMSHAELKKLVREKKIKSVIDLRLSTSKSEEDGLSERRLLQKLGVRYHRLPMRSSRQPTKEQAQQIIDTVKRVRTPALVHCSSGTHRSAFFSAIWLLAREGKDFDAAASQFSTKYGFFQLERDIKAYFQGHPTLETFLWRYGEEIKESPKSFEEWVASQPSLGHVDLASPGEGGLQPTPLSDAGKERSQ